MYLYILSQPIPPEVLLGIHLTRAIFVLYHRMELKEVWHRLLIQQALEGGAGANSGEIVWAVLGHPRDPTKHTTFLWS